MNTPNTTRNTILTLAVSAVGLVGIATFEGYRGDAYRDSVGVPTIGYGETSGVKMGQKTTPERALVQLLVSAEKHAKGVRKCVTVPLYQHEFDAYVSLTSVANETSVTENFENVSSSLRPMVVYGL